jgi:hypothetical protein
MSASFAPEKGIYRKMALVLFYCRLPPSTVSWDKQALPATQSDERVKESKGSEPHSPRQRVGGERGDGVEQDDRKSGGFLHVRPLRSMCILYASRYAQSSQTVWHAFYPRDFKIQWISVENSPTV